MYYHNYVNGERNLQGTVAIASDGSESGRFTELHLDHAKEGDITWQADKDGQGKYVYGEINLYQNLNLSQKLNQLLNLRLSRYQLRLLNQR